MDKQRGYTGARRNRKTSWRTHVGDRTANIVITLGGIGTIAAVLLVCVFLVWVAAPLFRSADVEPRAVQPVVAARDPWLFAVDEYRTMGLVLDRDGVVRAFRLDTGTILSEQPILPDADDSTPPDLSAVSIGFGDDVAVGFANGDVRLGRIGFASRFVFDESRISGLAQLDDGEAIEADGGLVQRTPEGQYRLQSTVVEMGEPLDLGSTSSIHLIAHAQRSSGPMVAVVTADRRLQVLSIRERKNLLTGKVTRSADATELSIPDSPPGLPSHLLLSGLGDHVFLAWPDGQMHRYDVRSPNTAGPVETVDLVDGDARLTELKFMLGGTTLIAGDSSGRVSGWFGVRSEDATSADGRALVKAHELAPGDGAVTGVASSSRSRLIAVGYETGRVRVFQMTTEAELADLEIEPADPVAAVEIAPKDDGIAVLAGGALHRWDFEPGHPEATLRSMFRPVWYEGAAGPEHVWQSSSGTDDFEPKYGMMPLIFGTLKATLYSMLFGAPLAIFAAIYTSEFLHPRVRARVKPAIELMAGLPSVVLGFLAALVIAPFVENVIPAVLTSLVTVPIAFLLGGHLWQVIPDRFRLAWSRWRIALIALCFPLGIVLGVALAPLVESWLFAGDIKRWLDDETVGTGAGAWMFIWLPGCALLIGWASGRFLKPFIRSRTAHVSQTGIAAIDLAKFIAVLAATVVLAWAISAALTAAGFDPRGGFVGTYIQRNALVVGFAMGFAIIPIIYTIAEDALSSVPDHLRAASLGTGATQWQTAVLIIVPTAMSGLFSALMIGLGRAVGETMIVLMAAGNTPIMDWNVFNGFRTLSANIAVELPEAVRDSTHYRTLFLAALVLFIMTFIVNTAAEWVRLRVRRRYHEL